jgi:pimeloyl-ACP methyl ester carboxylesterase
MNRITTVSLKILKWVGITILSLIVLSFLTRWIGQGINRRTPSGGINKSMYVDINGSKQWISIYGQDKDNPVLLYLHGGPGASTSLYDYAFTRKWSDAFTVVTWDQRGCGKSYDNSHPETITADIMMQDGKAMTEFLRDCLQVEKITLLGHSWGSYFGANLALAHPEYYEAFIGTGQFVDGDENERRLYEAALTWSENDPKGREMVEKWRATLETGEEDVYLRSEIMERYGYGMMKDGTDYSLFAAVLFNPYYSLKEILDDLNCEKLSAEYKSFFLSDGFREMSLLGRYDYTVPYYNINGDIDYQTNYSLACEYFQQVNAPKKQMFVMKDATHGLLESRSEEFSGYLHQIAAL